MTRFRTDSHRPVAWADRNESELERFKSWVQENPQYIAADAYVVERVEQFQQERGHER